MIKNLKNRVIYFNDQSLHFNRIDRDEIKSVIYNLENKKVEYTDYHMPIPYGQYKEVIEKFIVCQSKMDIFKKSLREIAMILYDILLILIYFFRPFINKEELLILTGSDSTHFNSLVNLLNSLKKFEKRN